MQNNVRQLARLGLMVAVLEVSKLALAAIPNIELVSFWVAQFICHIRICAAGRHFVRCSFLVDCLLICMDHPGRFNPAAAQTDCAALLGHVIRLVWLIFRRAVRNPLCSGGYIKRRIVERFSGRLFLVDCRHPLRFAALRRQLYHHADTV